MKEKEGGTTTTSSSPATAGKKPTSRKFELDNMKFGMLRKRRTTKADADDDEAPPPPPESGNGGDESSGGPSSEGVSGEVPTITVASSSASITPPKLNLNLMVPSTSKKNLSVRDNNNNGGKSPRGKPHTPTSPEAKTKSPPTPRRG